MRIFMVLPLSLFLMAALPQQHVESKKAEHGSKTEHARKVEECRKFQSQEEWHKRFMANDVSTPSPCSDLKPNERN